MAVLSNWVKIDAYMCACDDVHSRSMWAKSIANIWLSYTNILKNFEMP